LKTSSMSPVEGRGRKKGGKIAIDHVGTKGERGGKGKVVRQVTRGGREPERECVPTIRKGEKEREERGKLVLFFLCRKKRGKGKRGDNNNNPQKGKDWRHRRQLQQERT